MSDIKVISITFCNHFLLGTLGIFPLLFMSLGDLTKLPAMILCLGEPPGGFDDVGCCCCCCCFSHWRFLHFRTTFPCHWHSTSQVREGLHQLWALPWLLSVALLLPGFSVTVLPRAVLSGHFLPTGAFLPCSPSLHFWHVLWLRFGQKHPIQDPPLCLPSQSCPFRLTHGPWICSSMQTINSVPFPRLPKDSFSLIGVYQLPLFHWPDEKGDLCFSRQWEFFKFDFHHNNLTKNT